MGSISTYIHDTIINITERTMFDLLYPSLPRLFSLKTEIALRSEVIQSIPHNTAKITSKTVKIKNGTDPMIGNGSIDKTKDTTTTMMYVGIKADSDIIKAKSGNFEMHLEKNRNIGIKNTNKLPTCLADSNLSVWLLSSRKSCSLFSKFCE